MRHDEPRPPRKLNDLIPRDLETICLRAMAKEAGRRYGSARELAEDLRRWLNGQPIMARPVGQVERAVKWAKQNGKPGQKLLVFLCDGGQKYVSKIFNDEWMRENGFLEDQPGLGTVKDVLGARYRQKVVTATTKTTVRDAIDMLKQSGISQLPVVEEGHLRGIVAERY